MKNNLKVKKKNGKANKNIYRDLNYNVNNKL